MPTPDDKQFATFRRGQIRDDVILASMRNSMRARINPDTGSLFTEDEIAVATQQGSRYWIEANAIDLLSQAAQGRSAFLADQTVPHRSNTTMLEKVHGRLWLGEDSRLPAVGSAGNATANATEGSIFPGSTTLGDPTAAIATNPDGTRYQVTEDTTVDGTGTCTLPMAAIDTGIKTNIDKDTVTVLTWSQNQPLGAEATCSTDGAFSGGYDIETDAEYADRIEERIRYRPACGNSAHFLAWGREATVAAEYVFVYPCAFYAGSVLVCPVQKRATKAEPAGPEARTDVGPAPMAALTNYLVPPNSPVVPSDPFVRVVAANEQSSDVVLQISMGIGTSGGWYDRIPWPNPAGVTKETIVGSGPTQTLFTVTVNNTDYLPGQTGDGTLTGDDCPAIMIWDNASSRFERLLVSEISKAGTTVTITLSEAPATTITVGMRISPFTENLDTIAESAEAYFDELGPGELFDIDTDPRGARAKRFPPTNEKYPARAGQTIVTRVVDALGNVSPDASLVSMSETDPDYPTEVADGPSMIVLGHLTIFPL